MRNFYASGEFSLHFWAVGSFILENTISATLKSTGCQTTEQQLFSRLCIFLKLLYNYLLLLFSRAYSNIKKKNSLPWKKKISIKYQLSVFISKEQKRSQKFCRTAKLEVFTWLFQAVWYLLSMLQVYFLPFVAALLFRRLFSPHERRSIWSNYVYTNTHLFICC